MSNIAVILIGHAIQASDCFVLSEDGGCFVSAAKGLDEAMSILEGEIQMLVDSGGGGNIVIGVEWKTQEEIDAMPEFEGW